MLLVAMSLLGCAGAEGTFNATNTVKDIIEYPAFAPFGRFVLPLEWGYEETMPLSRVSTLLPYHNHIETDDVIGTLDHMVDAIQAGNLSFHDIYTDAEKAKDATKQNSGLFFFKGKPGMPFVIVCAGGGFSYVGSIHESFPHAIALSQKGYNAFAIQYRTGGAELACEDLAVAITFVFQHAEELGVSTKGYSLWGGSAGARMAAYLGSYGPAAFGGDDLPRPGTVVMQYTGHADFTPQDPPTFAVVGTDDGIANPETMRRRIETLQSLGIDAEYHLYPNVRHGFGLGTGTSAEGWLDEAVVFWEKHMKEN